MNFLPALLPYRYISGLAYFDTLNMTAMFIILVMGVDDIFVICDPWAQYCTAAPDAPMDKRLTAMLKHAGKVIVKDGHLKLGDFGLAKHYDTECHSITTDVITKYQKTNVAKGGDEDAGAKGTESAKVHNPSLLNLATGHG